MEPSEVVLRGLLAAAPDALLVVDAEGLIVFANDQAERLFGWSQEDLFGERIEQLVPERFAEAHPRRRAEYEDEVSVRSSGVGLELWARRKDGTEFAAEISLSRISDEHGEPLVVAGVRDVSDRMEAQAIRQHEALAEQAHRLESLRQLAGGIAHDFNNLLGVILSYATLLAHRTDDPSSAEDLGEIRVAAERGAALTRRLLTFASRDVVDLAPLDVVSVVRGLYSKLAHTAGEVVRVDLDLPNRPLVALADSYQVEQVLVNLVVNARDAMPAGGVVTIAARAAETGLTVTDPAADVVLTITDEGSGMAPEVLDRAFEPFFTTKPAGEGTGLGLATVYGIVQRSGGEVRIDSDGERGTTITIVLRGAMAQPRAVGAAQDPLGGSERLLLVEDEPALRAAMARVLGARGYDVVVASDGLEALDVYEADDGRIELVLTDVSMPRMRGDGLAAELAARGADVPVIFMSGYAAGEAPMGGRLLPKPVTEDVLLRAIREVFDG